MIRLPFSRTLENYVRGRKRVDFGGWDFSVFRREMIVHELSDWQIYYLPVDLRGRVVLDVGAGEGETAKFFLEHGADSVFCVECDYVSYKRLLKNSRRFKGVYPLYGFFDSMLLNWSAIFDFIKIDIEGYEECLLHLDLKVPAVVEVHGLWLRDRFREKGYRIVDVSDGGCKCFSYAYWMC